MRPWILKMALAVACLVCLTAVLPARALVVAPPPGPNRVAQADVIVTGRVIGHEPQDIQLAITPGNDAKTTYRVAIVNVTETIRGIKNVKSVRVAFMPPPAENDNGGGIRPIRGGIRGVVLNVGVDGLFFLAKHHSENVYLAPMYYDVVASANNPNYEKELGEAKRAAKLIENPMAGLKSANADERFQTASMLIASYRNPRKFSNKTEPISAEESKLILKAIAEGNWNAPRNFGQQGPWEAFNQLGLTAKEGWKQPQNVKTMQDFHRAAQDWLRTHSATHRIERFVPTVAAKQ